MCKLWIEIFFSWYCVEKYAANLKTLKQIFLYTSLFWSKYNFLHCFWRFFSLPVNTNECVFIDCFLFVSYRYMLYYMQVICPLYLSHTHIHSYIQTHRDKTQSLQNHNKLFPSHVLLYKVLIYHSKQQKRRVSIF